MKYKIGTRGSRLALAQTEYVRRRLEQAYPQDSFEVVVIQTKGDRIIDRPLAEIGDKGLFVAEIEQKLQLKEIDLAVHSMKDMPGACSEKFVFAKAWEREDPRDVLILREKASLGELPSGALIGTGSARRAGQLRLLRPDITVVDIRGNVDTRLKKMRGQKLDGIILAAAGLKRIGREDEITAYFEIDEMVPAPTQGTLAIELRREDTGLLDKINALSDERAQAQTAFERAFLQEIGADCHMPVGAYADVREDGSAIVSAVYGARGEILKVKMEGTEPAALAKKMAAHIRSRCAGKVSLVGAGPGDPGLLTVKGRRCIENADCIIYDRLASPELLCYAKPECECIYVGKENHHHTMPQDKINRLLVEKAMRCKSVVRLKGGDVYVFGRGGEEGLYLRECGVPFEIVPGVTSAIAGPAYAGIPLTHRGSSSGFHVVTAHSRKDELTELDFQAMADETVTCVFLMGLAHVGQIAQELQSAGRKKDTPVAVISHATMPQQNCLIGTLCDIEEKAAKAQLTSPAVIVVGDVVSFRQSLNFFEERPLFGKRYLVAKIDREKSRLTELLEEQGAQVQELLVGQRKAVPVVFQKEELAKVSWFLFTSRYGVEALFGQLMEQGFDIRAVANARFAVIGDKTREALGRYHIHADLVPSEANAEALKRELLPLLQKEDVVWCIKAENAPERFGECFSGICNYAAVCCYVNAEVCDSSDCLWSEQTEEKIEYTAAFFTCASSVVRYGKASSFPLHKIGRIYAIGRETRQKLAEFGLKNVYMPEAASYEALVEYEVKLWQTMPILS